MSIRVVVADDQDLVRTGLVMILGAHPDLEVVGEAADGIQALELARRLRPDVLLVDIRMPGLDGVEGDHGGRNRAGRWIETAGTGPDCEHEGDGHEKRGAVSAIGLLHGIPSGA